RQHRRDRGRRRRHLRRRQRHLRPARLRRGDRGDASGRRRRARLSRGKKKAGALAGRRPGGKGGGVLPPCSSLQRLHCAGPWWQERDAGPEGATAGDNAGLLPTGKPCLSAVQLLPVVREVPADLDTPLSVYLKLADGPHTYLFESVDGGERFGRYSIIGLPARRVYAFAGHTLYVSEHGELLEAREVADPFAEVERLRRGFEVPRLRDAAGKGAEDQLGTPDILLM